jgi:ribonuclease D
MARELVTALSAELNVPVENLLQPDALRRLCWSPPVPADAAGIAEFLRGRGAREWQLRLLAGGLERAFADAAHEPGVKAQPLPQ